MKKIILSFLIFLLFISAQAQLGKNGALVVAAAKTVNEYTALTADATAGTNTLTVAAATLNANGRFAGNLAVGDLVLVIQMQGALIKGTLNVNVALENDSTWGNILNYNNCGLYEFQEVNSISGNTITTDCALKNNYTALGRAQVVRVPRYTTLTINNGGNITCDPWLGATGGVLAVEVQLNTVINTGGQINATGKGYRGGALLENNSNYSVRNFAAQSSFFGAEKGEGIFGYQADYDPIGGRYGKGAPGNAGGGGNAHNAGGAGGANGGAVNGWNGHGVPDISTANYIAAWNLDYPWISTTTSSGGGKGGYTFASSAQNPVTLGPYQTNWSGDYRDRQGGFGGRPVDYSTGRLFMGGGGGSGDQDNNVGGAGGNGGGLIYVMNYGTISGAGQVISNGNNGFSTPNSLFAPGIDGAGGAGAGGTVILNSVGAITGISIAANGGNGGNQLVQNFTTESEGPGGGGGGGYIAVSNGAPVQTATGGVSGTTNNAAFTNFPFNGATKGGVGTTNQTITNFTFTASNVTICTSNTATLTASGTLPVGTSFEWYTSATGGAAVGSGSPFVTPVLVASTTYYVGTCPGTYRIPVVVTVTPGPTANAGSPATICVGNSTTLGASGGTTYSWSPATALSSTTIANPVANPVATTTYTVTVGNGSGCTSTATVTITVVPGLTASAGSNAAICQGGNTTLNASGGTIYSWSPAAGLSSTTIANPVATPAATTTYTVTVTNGSGCTGTATVTVTVNALPTASAGAPVSICSGGNTTLTATGGTSYSWSPSAGLSSTTVANPVASPAATTTYTATVTNASGCSNTATVTVTVNPNPVANAGAPVTICIGNSTTLGASGGTSYSWSPATALSSTTIANPVANPVATTTYTVTATNGNGCTNTATVTVTVVPGLTASAGAPASICQGGSTTLNASGGTIYSWSPAAGLSSTTIANPVATPAATTTYTVAVTNGSGCTGSATVTITVNPLPTASAGGPVSECAGSGTTLTATGGTSYSWSPAAGLSSTTVSNPTATDVSNTTYTVTVTDVHGCINTATVSVTVNPLPTVSGGSAVAICNSGSTTLQATGAVSYTWSPGTGLSSTTISNPVASPTATTIYTVTGTDANGCVNHDTVTVSVGNNLTPVVSPNTAVCAGSSTNLTASGGTIYSWTPAAGLSSTTISNPVATPASTTTYTVTVTNSSGCNGTADVTVSVNPLPTANAGSNTAFCAGSSVGLNATGGTSYSWSPSAGLSSSTVANPTANPAGTTTYTVAVTDVNGCVNTASVIVTVNPLPTVTVTGPTSVCAGSNVTLTANGATSYTWSPGTGLSSTTIANPTASPASTITYTVTGTDANNCVNTGTSTLTVNPLPVVSLSATPTSGCAPLCVQFTQTSSGSCTSSAYVFGDASTGTTADPSHCYTTPGTYSVTFSCTSAGCTGTTTVPNMITVNPKPTAAFTSSPASPIIFNSSAPTPVCFTDQSVGAISHGWFFGNATSSILQNPCVTYSDTGTFCTLLVVTNAGGCMDSLRKCIDVISPPAYSIPNVFTPNGDGKNDLFFIQNSGLKTLDCSIYDRWGVKIYEFSTLNGSWDGKSTAGEKLTDGTYYYLLKMQTLTGEIKQEKGFVQLIAGE
jgi:gliding motility-associated-like protein